MNTDLVRSIEESGPYRSIRSVRGVSASRVSDHRTQSLWRSMQAFVSLSQEVPVFVSSRKTYKTDPILAQIPGDLLLTLEAWRSCPQSATTGAWTELPSRHPVLRTGHTHRCIWA